MLVVPVFALVGCAHHHPVASAPAPPALTPTGSVVGEDMEYVASHDPIDTLRGMASWYGPNYNRHRAANGQVYDQNAVTAANRTLPMNSLIKVTNERTGQSAVMRITDRGPFVPDRILDLSMAAAKETGLYRAGVAPVRIDVYQAPKPIREGGRWCVQIGAFAHTGKAIHLRHQLERRYPEAQVIDFAGPTGHWVRIRPAGDNREQAEAIERHLHPAEGNAYLVRLD